MTTDTRTPQQRADEIVRRVMAGATAQNQNLDWQADCMLSSKGRLLPILANVLKALRGDPRVKECIARDAMFCGPMLMKPIWIVAWRRLACPGRLQMTT